MLYQLILDDITLQVSLGHLPAERSLAQQVLLQIKLRFTELPLACTTDNLQDSVCYASLADELQAFCEHRSFKLIEALGHQLYCFLRTRLTEIHLGQISVFLRVSKNPPVPGLGQASFEIGDKGSE